MKYFKFFLISLVLCSCGHFHDNPKLSVWAQGSWLFPWITGIGAAIFWIAAYRASKSGSTQQTQTGITSSSQKVKIGKTGFLFFAIFCTVLCGAIIIYFNSKSWK